MNNSNKITVFEFLSLLNSLDIKVWIENDQLRFRAPKGVMTPTIKQELIERKKEILSCLKEARRENKLAFEPILPVDRDEHLHLSFSQQRLWFIHQLDKQNPFYNGIVKLRITGALNVAALEQSFNEIILRHEALRTVFPTVDGLAVQKIIPTLTISISVVDVEGLEAVEIQQLVTKEIQQPFDLSIAPLLRVILLRQPVESHLLVLTMHHIIIDAWSMEVFFKELAIIYDAFTKKQPNPLPELAIQYADFALWQRQCLTQEIQQKQLDYWKQQLADAPPLLELPTDYPRPPVQTFSGSTSRFQIDKDLSSQLVTFSQKSGVTLFMTLLTAYAVLLHRYSGQDDICIGSPFANRDRQELESLIGFFVNTLVLRTNLAGNPSFHELLGRVREITMEAYAHQDFPFEMLVEALQPQRDLSHTPLFQVTFILQDTSITPVELSGLTVTSLPTETTTTKFDLTLLIENTAAGLVSVWEYNTDLFNTSTIERMARHFQTLLKGIVANPEEKISRLPLLTQVEQHQLLVEWNNTQTDYPGDKCIHQLFEEQVERTPDAVAVVFGNQQLTYNKLNSQANQLAHYLKSLGVGADVLVGLCVERSLEMVVGLLAILKAGGAYVPLDPEYPQERLQFMLADTQIKVLLTQEKFVKNLPQHQARVICLDTDWQSIQEVNQDNLNSTVSCQNLAYVIYTSGSTGTPKGVVVTHQAVNRLVFNTNYIQLTPDDRVAQAANIAFDAATFEIWGALLHGAKLVILNQSVMLNPKEFAANMRSGEVSVLFLTTALFNQLASFVPQAFSSLRYLLFGGEAVDPGWVQEVLDKGAPQHLLHVYGPTENTTFSTWYLVEKLSTKAATIPIGRAISNTQIYLLDQNLQPVPIGIPGELYLGGVGLARGYLNRPELTQEKFISNPFSTNPHSHLYKTGDLGRYLPNGNIEYIRRIDNQVKIRGFRIELGEMEAVLSQNRDVKVSCVIAKEDSVGAKCLVAYVVSQKDVTLTTGKLRQFLADKLPGYMLPSAFVILDSLPLTPNGKVNRRALPDPDLHQELSDYVMPNTEAEKILADIWQKALKVEKVGIYNNFFELGGHSLLLVKINQQLQEIFGFEVSIVDMFNYPTIHSLSQYLNRKDRKTDSIKQNNSDKQSNNEIKSLKIQQLESRQQYRSQRNNARDNNSEIAIIAVAGRFPGAKDIQSFWQNIHDGVESISIFTDEELLESGVSPNLLNNPNYVKASPVVSNIEFFDANFFAYSAKEAELIDPQQRLFLELAWEAIEKAGYDPQTYNGSIGVYAGVGMNHYAIKNIYSNHQLLETLDYLQLVVSNEKDFLPTRVAYKLNLTGPAVNVQTACSTSLVAVHQACQSLLNRECDIALAGGVSLGVPQKTGYLYQEGMILSPDGHCRSFDAKAQGTIAGSGAGIVVLKRLEDAISDRDYIHAIIKSSAINNDEAMKVGYTAPSVSGQAAVIGEAQSIAGVDAETISYIEAHGTATPLGDPIEIAALTQAFRQATDKKGFCAIGSLKSNLGHLDTAAGVAGLIKTVLALQNKMLPPSLHFETPSPKIDFANSPFYVNTTLKEWKTDNTPRRAGVSSFGMGGTNAHVILEEAPLLKQGAGGRGQGAGSREQGRNYQLLCLSAKTENALEKATNNLMTHLKEYPELNLGDVAYTLNSGRRGFNYRRMLICQDTEDAVEGLSNLEPKQVFTNYTEITERSVVFMFPGQGSQYVNMAREIYETQAVFKEQVDYCSEILKPLLGLDLRHILYPNEDKIDEASKQLQQTAMSDDKLLRIYAQPAIFVIEYALAQLWQSWGVEPQAAIGHSIGEYVAATLAGVFSLEDALSLVAARGQMMQQLSTGAMLSVPLPAEKVKFLLGSELSIAAINQPSQCVVSGSVAAIEALKNQLAAQGIECRRLHTSHAFHSQMMQPILDAFAQQVKKITLNPPKLPYISNLTGTWITVTQATNPDYYTQHLRSTVLFAQGVEKLLATPEQVLLEVGPGHTLTTLVKRHPDKVATQTVLTSVRHPQDKKSDNHVLFTTLGQLWLAGVKIDWFGFYSQDEYSRLPLPTYPFERQRYWIEPAKKHSDEFFKITSSSNCNHSQPENLSTIHTRPNLPNSYVAYRNEIEEKIADIWQELLGIKLVGIHDNFFELGGDSLIGVQFITRLRNTFAIQLSVDSLFEFPTIAEIAPKLEQQLDTNLGAIDREEIAI
ncbi:MAG: amino acid adenylation domain-containing protein [Nostoc sp.]|uniref:non-ribosomal peptide synthetase/type I polyketide synthase n=1 Tax=Nostoc sp. TaxID=1180 RepID=UPI002FFD17D7